MQKKTKIVCTIGPASAKLETLKKMIKAGMNVARLNFSHGTYPQHKKLINLIRQASKQTGETITILQDLQGPRIRLGDLPEHGIEVNKGQRVIFNTETAERKSGRIPVTYDRLHKEIKPGHRILVADGLFEFKVDKISGKDIYTTVVNGGKLTSHKGMNLPDTSLSISSVSEKDNEDLKFGISQNVDLIALSFVRNASDVVDLRQRIAKYERASKIKSLVPPMIIVKIEMREAIENFDSILNVTDAVMVARGDLGIEMPAEEVPLLQKDIINKCNKAGKPVIVATQMLESMIVNPRPTRAEVSDVANAVIDRTDAVMLSGESAMGKYPVEAVEIMGKILASVEKTRLDDAQICNPWQELKHDEAIASAAAILSSNTHVKLMVILSMGGTTARMVSKYRPELPIYVTTPIERVARQLNLSWGIVPIAIKGGIKDEKMIEAALKLAQKDKVAKRGDQIILIKGHPFLAKRSQTRSIELITI